MNKRKQMGINRPGMYVVYGLLILQALLALLFFLKLAFMQMLPTRYLVVFVLVLLSFNLLAFFYSRKKGSAIIFRVLSVVLTALLLYGLAAVIKLDATLEKISKDTRLEVVQMSAVVLSEDEAVTIADLSGYRIGYVTDDASVPELMDKVNEAVAGDAVYCPYANILLLVDALLDGREDAVLMNQAYIQVIADQDGYTDFSSQVRILETVDVTIEREAEEERPNTADVSKEQETESEEEVNLPVQAEETAVRSSEEDAFVVYISGIDTFGHVNVKSRSDVNILMAVNRKTGQVQLVNTPRDYYVLLPEKGGKDKLTHAGLYGVECSMGALEQLYGVEIDYYLRMNFSGFENIIDALGGIDVYSEYDFTVEPIKHYTAGYNHLSGIEALAFARERHAFAAGDVQRGKNQMEVIKAMVRKLSSIEMLTNYGEILNQISDCFQTNMPSEVLYDLVRVQLSEKVDWQIDSYSVAGTGDHQSTYSMPGTTTYVMIPDEEAVDEAVSLLEGVLANE